MSAITCSSWQTGAREMPVLAQLLDLRALWSLCADAVRHGATSHNPVSDSRPIACPRKQVRALTVGEAVDLQVRLRQDADAVRWDLPDLVQFMLGTGVRIGEAAAIRRAVLDLEAGTLHVNATVVRMPGQGLRIQPRTKTTASERIVALPVPVLEMLLRRTASIESWGSAGVVFTSPTSSGMPGPRQPWTPTSADAP
jgi:integrase